MCSPYPEIVLTNTICIEKALKRTEIVFVPETEPVGSGRVGYRSEP